MGKYAKYLTEIKADIKAKRKEEKNLCIDCPSDIRGLCCYFSVLIKGVQMVCDDYCKFLNIETGRCSVYRERFQKNRHCLTLEEMKKHGTLPRKCLYVQNDVEYQARKDLRLYFDEFEIKVRGVDE